MLLRDADIEGALLRAALGRHLSPPLAQTSSRRCRYQFLRASHEGFTSRGMSHMAAVMATTFSSRLSPGSNPKP